ncbi:MAG: DsrE family protein [Bacterioplanes sp.]|nr:DsrE family protein [Bacterioplanes sp.]
MRKTTTLVIIQSPPSPDLEALDVVLALAAFDTDLALLFLGAGKQWLHPSQQAMLVGGKSPSKALAALPMYGCDDIYYLNNTDQSCELHDSSVATPLSVDQCQQLLTQCQHCLSF